MINQLSNNKPSGTTSKQCDSGIPIMGRTSDTGEYQILKVNADGSLPISGGGGGPVPVTGLGTGYFNVGGFLPNYFNSNIAANIYLGFGSITPTALTAGIYRITVAYNIEATTPSAGINFMLVNDSSTIAGSLGLLFPGSAFSFNTSATGIYAQWLNITSTQITANIRTSITTGVHTQDMYLDAGFYSMHCSTAGAVNFTATNGYYGLYEFSKLS